MGDVKLAACLRALMLAYERRIRSDCTTSEELAKEPWRCAEYVAAEDALKPMKLQFTVEGLRNRIATESDEASYEAGVLHPEAPSPAAPVDGGFAAGIEAAAECADAQAARLRENGHSAMALQLDYCSEDIRALAPSLAAEVIRLREMVNAIRVIVELGNRDWSLAGEDLQRIYDLTSLSPDRIAKE